MADTHTVMPKKLAQALMDAGMQHFDGGGLIGGISQSLGATNNFQPAGVDNVGNIQQQYGQQQTVYGQQQALAAQLLAQTQGQGPGNNLIAQQGAKNAAQQSAVMANVRGASANPGAVARNAAIAGQQGQEQTLNAQSNLELQSQNALAQQQSAMANQSLQGQSIGQGALSAANTIGAGVAGQNATTNAGIAGGIFGGLSAGIGSFLSKGGEVKGYDVGGMVNDNIGIANYGGSGIPNFEGPKNSKGQTPFQAGAASSPLASIFGGGGGGGGSSGGSDSSMNGMAMAGGPMDASGGGMGDLGLLALANKGGTAGVSFGQMLAGGNVPGQANVKGDSKKNDTVPTMLSPGEIVLPRSVTESPDMEKKAIEFLKHLKSNKKAGYSDVAAARKNKGA